MAELTIDLTYGTALFEAARETGKRDLIMKEATEVLDIFKQEPDLHAFLNFPTISAQEKKSAVEKIFGEGISQELKNFIFVLIDKRRMAHFEKMVKVYKRLMDAEEGLSYGTVYSVEPLNESYIEELEAEATKLLGSKVKLDNEIDKKIIGGVKIMVDGKVIDATIRKRFDDIRNRIKNDQGGLK